MIGPFGWAGGGVGWVGGWVKNMARGTALEDGALKTSFERVILVS